MTLIRAAITDADLAAVRALCWDYRAHLAAVSDVEATLMETFYPVPDYTALMAGLAQAHARPRGIILLAEREGDIVGCGMTRPLDATSVEIKRLYVAQAARGHGIAAQLMQALMDQARADGYRRALLDTSKNLHPARALYAKLGFAERGPYQDIPATALPHLVFFEARL